VAGTLQFLHFSEVIVETIWLVDIARSIVLIEGYPTVTFIFKGPNFYPSGNQRSA
jgi:hypothetical protein